MTKRKRPPLTQTQDDQDHIPVLLNEVIENLAITSQESFVDATFGAGGYSRAILQQGPHHLYSFDRDPNVLPFVSSLQKEFPNSFTFIPSPFSRIKEELAIKQVSKVHGIVADIGVSSMQLDHAERGFSFQHDGPLDMRMAQQGQSAADVVNTLDEEDLSSLIKDFGEEKHATFIAKKIIQHRSETPFTHTLELANLIKNTYPGYRHGKTHPATKTFQALRIYVNQELEELHTLLESARDLLYPGGRLAIVTFHSLEDRAVKNFFKKYGNTPPPRQNRHLPVGEEPKPTQYFGEFKPSRKKMILPSNEEQARNRRSRSAKLRVYIKT